MSNSRGKEHEQRVKEQHRESQSDGFRRKASKHYNIRLQEKMIRSIVSSEKDSQHMGNREACGREIQREGERRGRREKW